MCQLILMLLTVLSLTLAKKSEGDTCVDEYTQAVGHCAYAENCESARQDFQANGTRQTFCGTARDGELVCCRDDTTILATGNESLPASTTGPPNNRYDSDGKWGSKSRKKCLEYSKQTKTWLRLRDFPHMAAIGWKDLNGNYDFDCGGSLISERFVLTAAHCALSKNNKKPVMVRLADDNEDPNIPYIANPDVAIDKIYKHPKYKSPSRYHDIALFKLATDLRFSHFILPACLWTDPDFKHHQEAKAAGWGVTETGYKSNLLLAVNLTIMDNAACNISLSHIINRKWSHGFDETQMCADGTHIKGAPPADTCAGDSGTPLQVVANDLPHMYMVIGITSFGPSVCGSGPAVYTRVSSYIDWIESVVWPNE